MMGSSDPLPEAVCCDLCGSDLRMPGYGELSVFADDVILRSAG